MEGWMIIIGIALVRGVGAWMKRRNDRLEESESSGSSGQSRPEGERETFRIPGLGLEIRLPRPPLPQQEEEPPELRDAYADEAASPEGAWYPPRQFPAQMEDQPEVPSWQNSPVEESQVYEFQAAGAARDAEDAEEEKRRALMERLAQATAAGSTTPGPRGLDVDHAPRPHASAAEHIHREKLHANELLKILRTPNGIRHAFLLKELLGPPVALRGPLRAPPR